MNSISVISLGLITPFIVSCGSKNKPAGQKPNILFLLADDMGYGEPGCYGQTIISTPFLDSLAKQSMRFTDFYAGTSVSSPSRASLMTGKHAGHTTIRGNMGIFEDGKRDRVSLKKDEVTLGDMLHSAGYFNGFIGKWHMEDPNDLDTWPIKRGFDYVVQEQWSSSRGGRPFNDGRWHFRNGWSDSIFYDYLEHDCIDDFRTDCAMEFLDERDKTKPFFLFMSYRSPHAHERVIRDTLSYKQNGWPEVERKHAARITFLDEQMKRLMDRLEKDGLLDNTLVIFTSDNGPHSELGHNYEFFNSNGELTGYKRDMYEGGIRVPLIVYWRGKVKPGTTSSHLSYFCDVMPTLADVAGVQPPDITDGISFVPEILGEKKKQQQHKYLYWELQAEGKKSFIQAARMGKWKAVRYGLGAPVEIYNLEEDITEKNNIADQQPEILSEMTKILKEARVDNEYFQWGKEK